MTTVEEHVQHLLIEIECMADKINSLQKNVDDFDDIYANYREHNAYLRKKVGILDDAHGATRRANEELQRTIAGLQHTIDECRKDFIDLDEECGRAIQTMDEYKEAIHAERIEHVAERQATNKAYHATIQKRTYAIEKLEAQVSNRDATIKYLEAEINMFNQDWHEGADGVYGMRSKNFKRLTEGFRGELSRHGKTIIITMPFDHQIAAKNAVKYITGQED